MLGNFSGEFCREAIKYRLEQMQITKKELGEIFNRKRQLTLEMVRNLQEKLNWPFESLIRAY